MKHPLFLTILIAAAFAPIADAAELFRDVAQESGVLFEHRSAPEKKYILESMSSGAAVFDYDGDGLLDLYLINSLTVETADQPKSAPSALYRNLGPDADGKLRFEDVSERAGVAFPGWGMGVCAADLDGDDAIDFYVTSVDETHLYRNRGDGTFADVTEDAGVFADGWAAGCAFADYDLDGDLDLFVSRYVEVSLDNLPVFGEGKTCTFRGIAVQCGPRGLPGTGDLFFRNDGDMRFTEVGKEVGVDDPDGYFGLGVAFLDLDGDRYPDIFVANDSSPNFLYLNKKDGTFEEAAFPLGVAVSEDGGEQGGMGVAVGDYDNRGLPSLFVTNFAEEYNAFYQNQGAYFNDVSFRTASGASSLPYVGWGTAFFDYDNDGVLDLIVVNGHVYPQLAEADLGASAAYRQRRLLYHGRGNGTFEEVAENYGGPLLEQRVSRGLAVGDLDLDGRLDVLVNDLDGSAQVLRNQLDERGGWASVRVEGAGENTSAIGAIVRLKAGKTTQTRFVLSGTSYLSQDDLSAHFGLGDAANADLEIRRPDGRRVLVSNIPVGYRMIVRR